MHVITFFLCSVRSNFLSVVLKIKLLRKIERIKGNPVFVKFMRRETIIWLSKGDGDAVGEGRVDIRR